MNDLTPAELEALTRYLEALTIVVQCGPPTAPTIAEMTDLGLTIEEATEFVAEWNAAENEADFADLEARRSGLAKLLNSQTESA